MRALLLVGLAALSLVAQPRLQRFTLPNGLRVVHLEDHERPLVRAWVHLDVAPADTPPGRQGLPLLALRMLGHSSAGGAKAADFDRLLEEAGVQLVGFPEPGALEWRLLTRSRDQDRAFGLLADRLLRPVFDPTVLEVQRLACWLDESRQELPPRARLHQALIEAPESRPTMASLGAITLEDLLVFRARVLRPDRAILLLHGDLGLEQAKRLVLLSLGTWTAPEPPPAYTPQPAGVPVQPPAGEARPRILAPGLTPRVEAAAVQPEGLGPEAAALLGLLLPGDPALEEVQIALEGSWLVATLEGKGANGARLLERLEALRQRGFTQIQLNQARATWMASRALESLDPGRRLQAALTELQGRQVQEARLQALSLTDLHADLRRWLDPARLRLGAVGDPEALKTVWPEGGSGRPAKP